MRLPQPLARRMVLLLLAVFLSLSLAGCSAVMLLLEYWAISSTINSIFDDDDDTYTLSGYVYIDKLNSKIAIQEKAEPPSEPGTWEPYSAGRVSIDTDPVRSTYTNAQGYFSFTGISDTRVILTVEILGADPVQFDVRLDSGTITPL